MEEPYFKKGDSVTLRSTLEMGRVESEPKLEGGEYWYRVRFVKRVNNVVQDDLDAVGDLEDTLESLVAEGRWGRWGRHGNRPQFRNGRDPRARRGVI